MPRSIGPSRGLRQIADAIDYIEERLADPIRIDDAAVVARYSPYHFSRVFHALSGETPGDYIKRRRLTCAARELTGGSRRILDIALDWGFESQAAFTRAFKRQFLLPPAAYRREGRDRLDLERAPWTPESFAHVGSGGISRAPRTDVSAGPFAIVGFEASIDLHPDCAPSGDSGTTSVHKLWEKFLSGRRAIPRRENEDLFYELSRMDPAAFSGGVTRDTRFLKLIGQAIPADAVEELEPPAGMALRRIPARSYAVFVHEGPVDLIQASCDYIYGVWARETDLRLAPGYEIQLFDRRQFRDADAESGAPAFARFEIYVPVEES
jgi:AraC family transcriptional regulator